MTLNTDMHPYMFWIGVGLVLLNVAASALPPYGVLNVFNAAVAIFVSYKLYE